MAWNDDVKTKFDRLNNKEKFENGVITIIFGALIVFCFVLLANAYL